MKSQCLRSAFIALLFASMAPAAAHAQNLGDNAALVYWQAIAQVPELSEADYKALDDWSAVPNDARAALVGELNAAVRLMTQGSAMQRSDWGIDMSPGPHTLLPHLAKVRELSRIALAAATEQMSQGKTQEAAETAIAVMRMARHLDPGGTLIEMLVQIAVEAQAERWIARHAPKMDQPSREYLLAELDRLPAAATAASSMNGEKLFIVWARKQFTEGHLNAVKDLATGESVETKGMEKADRGTLLKWLDETDRLYDQVIVAVQKPYPQPENEVSRIMQQVEQGDNLLARLFFPSIESVWLIEHVSKARLALLRAGLLWLNKSDQVAAAMRDPYGDGPFKIVEHDGGFTLQSKLEQGGKPVELNFGAEAKK